jgi:hypothetical protein
MPNQSVRVWIDRCDATMIAGWADNAGPLPSLDIHVNGRWGCSLRPDAYREDLERAGLGDGRRAFTFSLEGRLSNGENVIAVLHSGEVLVQRTLRQVGLTHPDAGRLSQERWRGDEGAEGLTWGRLMTGDSLWDIYERAHDFTSADRIVEFGPGYGRLLKTALDRKIPFRSFMGVELSLTRVHRLSDEFGGDPRISFSPGDMNTWRIEGHIDVILCSSTFEHLFPDCRQALKNFRSQLAQNATVLIDFIKSDSPHREFHGVTYIRYYSRDELSLLFAECGYSVTAIEECRLGEGVDGPIERFVVIAKPAPPR